MALLLAVGNRCLIHVHRFPVKERDGNKETDKDRERRGNYSMLSTKYNIETQIERKKAK